MLRYTLKFPYHGLPRFQKYGSSRLLSLSYLDSQKACPDLACPDGKKGKGGGKAGGGGSGFFYTIGLLTVATGGTIVYAKYDPEFRKWLNTQIPWSDRVIQVVFQEEESWRKTFENILEAVSLRTHQIISGFSSKKEVKKSVCDKIEKERQEFTPPRSVFSALVSQTTEKDSEKPWAEVRVLPEPSSGTQADPEIVAGERERKASEKDPSTLPETHPLNLVELEKNIQETAAAAVNSFHDAACAVQQTSLDILNLIEQSIQQTDEKGLQKIQDKFEKKEKLVKDAECLAQKALDNLAKLRDLVESSALDAPQSMKATALRNADRLIEEITAAKDDLENEKRNASIAEKYWKRVEVARKHYIDELLILFPDMRLSEKEWRINNYDLDLFIYYCFQNVLYYQKELAKLETIYHSKLNAALRGGGEKVDKELLEATVADALERQRRELDLSFQKKILEIQQSSEQVMRIQLKRQAEAHDDHLCDILALREKELHRKFAHELDEKLLEEQNKYKFQLSGLMGRLQGLEGALKARAHIDKGAHQAQVLWSACQALHCALKHVEPGIPWQDQLRPLQNEISAVEKAALEDDELVKAVLVGIPEQAKQRGVYSEAALRERFLHVERSARRVALVPNVGASLPVYFLSYLQSVLLIKTVNPIPEAELLNEPISFEKMDTYDVLQRARYWMERGNIEQTLRYMNLLSGASRKVSQDWMAEARIYLETKQAATVLMTHAAAAGLLYV